ncbi:hypothetical protein EI94DRAFT_1740508 [Lactarius quietus]|nr:hypothetical protein EI94DRAFT_1740508 [Lactarius quietus]
MNPATTSAASSQPPRRSHPGSGTPAQFTDAVTIAGSVSLAPNLTERSHHSYQTASSQLPSGAPRLMSSLPPGISIPEYQWGKELVDTLLALPPRSNFFGQFSVVADPDVDNFKRAQMFLDQLSSKGLPTSEVQTQVSGNPDAPRGHAVGLHCRCETGCQGRLVVSVDDDTTHLHCVPGQRIGVALLHSSR